ncbi:hypothetical protein Esti_004858 [Eimeria stiedai]
MCGVQDSSPFVSVRGATGPRPGLRTEALPVLCLGGIKGETAAESPESREDAEVSTQSLRQKLHPWMHTLNLQRRGDRLNQRRSIQKRDDRLRRHLSLGDTLAKALET